MNQQQIERTLKLHKRAYSLLMWLKEQARNNRSLLDARALEAISSAKSCEDWVLRHLSMIPVQLRPEGSDVPTFSHLFSSFFTTSFRVGQVRWWETVETTLVTGAKTVRGRRHKKHSERREDMAATELKRLALEALAKEEGLACDPLLIRQAVAAEAIGQYLSIWTYVRELVRRAEFASQGASVHRLWLALEERTRKNLSVEAVWQARMNLVGWLTKESSTKEQNK